MNLFCDMQVAEQIPRFARDDKCEWVKIAAINKTVK